MKRKVLEAPLSSRRLDADAPRRRVNVEIPDANSRMPTRTTPSVAAIGAGNGSVVCPGGRWRGLRLLRGRPDAVRIVAMTRRIALVLIEALC
jgi:hypothetical protein